MHCLLVVVEHVPQEDLMAVRYHPLSDLSEVLDLQLKQVPILLVVVQPTVRSIGIVMYIMLSGRPPFPGECDSKFRNIFITLCVS